MTILESGRKILGKLTGRSRPETEVAALLKARKPHRFLFKDDGLIPNHPHWPLIVYRSAVRLPSQYDPASVFEDLFAGNDWGSSWRNGIYGYVHYHSRIHEVLGVAAGHARVEFGGNRGRTLTLKAGDVAILPAGTGHKRLEASDDFLVVGAYPTTGTYDLCTRREDHDRAIASIPKVKRPATDPVYGVSGPLTEIWSTGR